MKKILAAALLLMVFASPAFAAHGIIIIATTITHHDTPRPTTPVPRRLASPEPGRGPLRPISSDGETDKLKFETMTDLDDLRYPVGRFSPPASSIGRACALRIYKRCACCPSDCAPP